MEDVQWSEDKFGKVSMTVINYERGQELSSEEMETFLIFKLSLFFSYHE